MFIHKRPGYYLVSHTGQYFYFTGDYIFGRRFFAGFLPADHLALISRQHFGIFYKNGKFYIYDLGSKNGTYVNGERVRCMKSTMLRPGDVITVAKVVNLRFWPWTY